MIDTPDNRAFCESQAARFGVCWPVGWTKESPASDYRNQTASETAELAEALRFVATDRSQAILIVRLWLYNFGNRPTPRQIVHLGNLLNHLDEHHCQQGEIVRGWVAEITAMDRRNHEMSAMEAQGRIS